jgi:predicted O-methyltransferase YrrM
VSEFGRITKTFFAYLKRPDLYPELGRKIVKNTFQRGNANKGQEKSNQWAASLAISDQQAIEKLFGFQFKKFDAHFSDIFKFALDKQNTCPIKMGGAGALELIYAACEFTQAKNVVETGVAYGWSSLAALASLEKRNGTLYSSDMPYLGQDGDQYVGYVVPENLKKQWELFRFADRESLPKIFEKNKEFDVVHYDSDKAYNGMIWAYGELYSHLRKGGVFISDDINDNAAFQDFCQSKNIQPTIVSFEDKFIGVFVK